MRQLTSVFLTTLLLLCGCLITVFSSTACAIVPQEAPLVLHTSLVELFNAANSQWSVSIARTTPTDAAIKNEDKEESLLWTDMQEVWVEGQPLESAASLLFALPPSTSTHYQIEDVEGEEAQAKDDTVPMGEKNIVHGDNVPMRAQRRQLFGHPTFSFHGFSCEEYSSAEHHRRGSSNGNNEHSALRGRCYLLRDNGEDVFFNYRVEAQLKAATNEERRAVEEEGHSGAARRSDAASPRRHHSTRVSEAAAAASTSAAAIKHSKRRAGGAAVRVPQTSSHTSSGDVWTEYVVLPGAVSGVVGAEGDIRVGSVRLTEHLTKEYDAKNSARVQLSFALAFFGAKSATTSDDAAVANATPVATIHVRVNGVTGAYCEQAVQHATMSQQASRTSFFNRWVFPVVYIGCLYGLVYGVAWLQAKRKSSAAASTGSAAGPAGAAPSGFPAAVKKQQ